MRLLDLPPTITVPEAGELLGLSRSAAYRAVDAGQLPTVRFGRKLRVPTPRLLKLLGQTAAVSEEAHEPSGRAVKS